MDIAAEHRRVGIHVTNPYGRREGYASKLPPRRKMDLEDQHEQLKENLEAAPSQQIKAEVQEATKPGKGWV